MNLVHKELWVYWILSLIIIMGILAGRPLQMGYNLNKLSKNSLLDQADQL